MSENKTKTILAIGAHPDDLEFGCGGILLQEAGSDARIEILVCSRGESGTNGSPEQRTSESEAAAKLIGANLRFLDFGGDALIEREKRHELAIAQIIRSLKPDTLLAPTTDENQHPDHAVVGRLARDAARLARFGGLEALRAQSPHRISNLFYYSIGATAPCKGELPILVDISTQEEKWIALMRCHASQMKTRNYVELQLAKARALGLSAGCSLAQALYPNDPIVIERFADLQSARAF